MQTFSRPFIVRQTETERLIACLLDLSSYGPVALTTQLKGTLGFGKTTLAQAVCADPRVIEMFSDGIVWVNLGAELTPLDLLRRAETVLVTLTGEYHGLTDLQQAQKALFEAIHPRRLLLVLDDAGAGSAVDEDAIRLFTQTGPGGTALIITHDDSILPLGTRRAVLDLMYSEAAELLGANLPLFGTVRTHMPDAVTAPEISPAPVKFEEQDLQEQKAVEDLPGQLAAQSVVSGPVDAAGPLVAEVGEPSGAFEPQQTAPTRLPDTETSTRIMTGGPQKAVSADVEEALPGTGELGLAALADRLNDWPLLLGLVNGLLHGCFDGASPECFTLADGLRVTNGLLDCQGLMPGWPVEEAQARERALRCVVEACLSPLSPDERAHWLALCVFPSGETVPVAVAAALWDVSTMEAEALMEMYALRALVQVEAVGVETGIGADNAGGASKTGGDEFALRIHPALLPVMQSLLGETSLTDLHTRLVQGLRSRTGGKWSNGLPLGGPAAQRYLGRRLAYHLERAGLRSELQSLLFDFDWLAAVLTWTRDLYGLLIDFQQALSAALDGQSAQLRLVQEALMDAAPVLAKNPDQLAPHLLGRLLTFGEPEIQQLLQKAMLWEPREPDQEAGEAGTDEGDAGEKTVPAARKRRRYPWLRPLAACFPTPGGTQVRMLEGHQGWVTGAAILPDGQFGISTSLDGTLRVWDLASGLDLRTWMIDPKGVPALAVSTDGVRAATAGWEGRVAVWDLAGGFATGTLQEAVTIHASIEPVGALAMTPDGKRLITGADDRMIRVWDLETGESLMELPGHTDLVRALAVTPDGRTLVSGSWDNTVRLWDLETGNHLHTLAGHTAWVRAVAVTPDGFHALSGGWDRVLRVWDLWTGEEVHAFPVDTPIYSITVTPDNKAAAAGSGDGQICLWDLETGATIRVLPGHKGGINALALTRSGRFALSASDDRTLRVWDFDAIQGIRPQPRHEQPICTLAPLPENAFAISASLDGSIKIWDAPNGREVCTLEAHPGGVAALTLSADGKTALSGGADCILRLWDLAAGAAPRELTGHTQPITCTSMIPDARLAVSGDTGGVLKVWDLVSGACLSSFVGEGPMLACAMASDGKTIVASAAGGKMYFLEVEGRD